MTATAERRFKCLRAVAHDGTIRRIALYPSNIAMSNGEVYYAPPYAHISDRNVTLEGGPTAIDLSAYYAATVFTRDELQSGKWDGASVYLFATDYAAPIEDEEAIELFTLGRVSEDDDQFVAELIGLQDKLNHSIGRVITAQCGKVFADTHLDGEPTGSTDHYYCKVAAASYTVTGTITSVDDATTFYDSARAEADDYFGNGEIIFTSGDNAGLSRRTVSTFLNSGGKIVVNYPFHNTPEVGDAYQMIAGCRKRYSEDCVTKFSNGTDFGGYPHVPVKSKAEQRGDK